MKSIDIGDTDENADWIKSLPGHEDELKIHEALAKKRGTKAADAPPPNVRGKPLPAEEATEGWEVTEEDMEAAQAWVDRAMEEAGFGD